MTVALAIAVLVVFDGVLAGYRAAAGRDGRIDKQAYFRAAMVRGALAGGGVVALNAALVSALVATAPDREAAWVGFVDAGADCVWLFGAFATATLVALALWLSPVPETRLLATVIVLGPLTLVRPLVIAGGLVAAAGRASDERVWIAAVVAGVTTIGVERVLARRVPLP